MCEIILFLKESKLVNECFILIIIKNSNNLLLTLCYSAIYSIINEKMLAIPFDQFLAIRVRIHYITKILNTHY